MIVNELAPFYMNLSSQSITKVNQMDQCKLKWTKTLEPTDNDIFLNIGVLDASQEVRNAPIFFLHFYIHIFCLGLLLSPNNGGSHTPKWLVLFDPA